MVASEIPTNGATGRRRGPEVVAPTNRINVALPFSQFRIQEPSRDLRELSEIVAELVRVVADHQDDPRLASLQHRVDAVTARMG